MGNIFHDAEGRTMKNFTWTEAIVHYLRINNLFKRGMVLTLSGIKFAI